MSKFPVFLQKLTKNKILYIIIAIVLILTFTVLLAEAVAPTQYKPRNLLAGNSSSKSSSSQKSTQPLTSDSNNEVYVSSKCDLAIKYPNKNLYDHLEIENIPSVVIENSFEDLQIEFNPKNFTQTPKILDQLRIQPNLAGIPSYGPGKSATIECFEGELNATNFGQKYQRKVENPTEIFNYFSKFSPSFSPSEPGFKFLNLEKKLFCEEITLLETSCDLISNAQKIEQSQADGSGLLYYFTYNQKTYMITLSSYEKKLQIQFDSLAPSTQTTKRTLAENSSSSISTSNKTSSSSSNVSEICLLPEGCTSTKPTKTYTNQYFPDFKLVYPEDWKFWTGTRPIPGAGGLLSREIILSKDNTSLKFNFTLAQLTCGPGLGSPKTNLVTSFGNGMNKLVLSDESQDGSPVEGKNVKNSVAYSSGKDFISIMCFPTNIQSNIDNKLVYDYYAKFSSRSESEIKDFLNLSKFVRYEISINQPNYNTYPADYSNVIKSDNPLIAEIDQIISQSTFK